MKRITQRTCAIIVATLGVLASSAAMAGGVALNLVSASLENDPDPVAGGTWQYEGGAIQNTAGTTVGHYILTRRVTTSGSTADNAATLTASLFFSSPVSGNAPDVITIEGAWSYTSGELVGSVSAASNKYHWIINADASGTNVSVGTTKLVLAWVGSNTQHVP